jgi:Rrf2 family protein
MKFSKKSEYGLRALIELTSAYGKARLQRHHIAQRQRIPVEFLEQILLALRNAGLLASRRGVDGGYSLIKPPGEVSLGQIIRILDGPLAPIPCVSKTAYQKCRDCPYADSGDCPLQGVMGHVRQAIADILDHYTLKDFAERSAGQSWAGHSGEPETLPPHDQKLSRKGYPASGGRSTKRRTTRS